MPDGLRLAVSLLTVVPVGTARVDRRTGGAAMLWAPLVGAALGATAGVVAVLARWLGLPPLPAGVLAVAGLALATRGLHLDGLADTADGLGSLGGGTDRERALAVMKSPDVGAFGVAALVLVGLAQVAAVADLVGAAAPHAPATATVAMVGATATAVATGRLAFTWACRVGIPAARPDGLGALVSGTVPTVRAGLVTALTVVAAGVVTGLDVRWPWWQGSVAVAVGVGAGVLFVRHCVRRIGGVTGDVLGAAGEVATTVALLVLVLR